jgi:hypothetical protein
MSLLPPDELGFWSPPAATVKARQTGAPALGTPRCSHGPAASAGIARPVEAELGAHAVELHLVPSYGDSGQTSGARRGADGLGPSGARRSSAVPSGNPRRGIVVADWLWRDGTVADPLHVGVERCRVGLDHLGVVGWVVGLRHA